MIFGENYGQLAASGEYEVYKSGTTLASLNEAIAGLSDEEFLDSFLKVAIDTYQENIIWYPYANNVGDRCYIQMYPHTSISQTVIGVNETCYWLNNNIVKVVKTQNVSTMKIEQTITSVSAGTVTLNSWTLYRRQKSYDVAISGSKAASAIAPVQDSLATANRNYAVGDQFYYDGHLYKVTAIIASGAQIVIGTNAELTNSVMEQMKGIIKRGSSQTASIPATTAGAVQDITIAPTAIDGYTPIAVQGISITHPLHHQITSYYRSGNNWIFRIGSINGTTAVDSLTVTFIYVKNEFLV